MMHTHRSGKCLWLVLANELSLQRGHWHARHFQPIFTKDQKNLALSPR
jgi:hypothetical protein